MTTGVNEKLLTAVTSRRALPRSRRPPPQHTPTSKREDTQDHATQWRAPPRAPPRRRTRSALRLGAGPGQRPAAACCRRPRAPAPSRAPARHGHALAPARCRAFAAALQKFSNGLWSSRRTGSQEGNPAVGEAQAM
jgi:hypothetical protein